MTYRLLALDIDGTLVNSNDEVSQQTHDALARAKSQGLEIVLATGRRYSRVLPLVAALGLNAPVVTASGALIKNPSDHRTLFAASFVPGILAQTLNVIAEHGHEAILYADTFAQGFDYYCLRRNTDQPHLGEFLSINAGSERHWPQLMQSPPADIFAGFAMADRDAMHKLEHALRKRLGENLYLHVIRSPRYAGHMCEIAPAGVSKWSGIVHLSEQMGIEPREICAVGDDVNDIPMLQGAGLGVAMGNASAAAKAAADRIAPTHDDHGLVQVVNWLLNP